MNRKLTFIIIIIVGLLAVAGVYIAINNPDNSQEQSNQAEQPITDQKISETEDDSTTVSAGRYVEYTVNIIADTSGTKLLFFHAPWCPQCRAIESDINSDGVPNGVTVIKVDYDSNQALRQKYGVTLQTTFVKVDDNGDLVEKFVAYDEPTFDSVKQNLL